MGRDVEPESPEVVEESRGVSDAEIRRIHRELATMRRQTKHAQISAGGMFLLVVLMFIGMMFIPMFVDGASYSYVDDHDSFLYDHIKVQQGEIAELTKAMAETQSKLQLLIDAAAEKCVAEFTDAYIEEHPYLMDAEDPYIALLLEGARIQAELACSEWTV